MDLGGIISDGRKRIALDEEHEDVQLTGPCIDGADGGRVLLKLGNHGGVRSCSEGTRGGSGRARRGGDAGWGAELRSQRYSEVVGGGDVRFNRVSEIAVATKLASEKGTMKAARQMATRK